MRKRLLLLAVAAVLVPVATQACPPRTLDYVDPNAPCFRWPALDRDGDGIFDRVDRCIFTTRGCKVDAVGCELDGDGDGVCDGLDECPETPRGVEVDSVGCDLGARADAVAPQAPPPAEREVERPKPAPQPVSPPQSEVERQLIAEGRIRLENVYFETNSAVLLPESEATLNQAGEALEKLPGLKIEVEGHTDTRGSNAHNLGLSQARAESVRNYLVERFRLEGANFVAKGYGETQPETRERNEEELLRNRRVVLRVLNPEALPRGVEIEHD